MLDNPGNGFDRSSKSLALELQFRFRSKSRSRLKVGLCANGDARVDGDFSDNDNVDPDGETAKTLVEELGIWSFSVPASGEGCFRGAYSHLSMLKAQRRQIGFVSSH